MKLGIFIPAYQAEKTLGTVFTRFPDALWSAVACVWVVDDGSVDATSDVVEKWRHQRESVKLHRFTTNCGYGAAVNQGLALVKGEGCTHAACLHADGQYPPEAVLAAVERMQAQGWDILQGSRHADGGARAGGMPFYKIWAGKALTRLENRCFGWRLTDYHSGFMVYGPEALRRIPFTRLSGYFDFDLEVLATACAKGLKVGEMAIPAHYADEISHLHPLRYGFRVLGVLLRFWKGHYARL